jgi:pyruvate-ferredoxin/flavodoxin oxidoreductase
MGADKNQALKAFVEAEAHKGPSIVIAYAPCINQGIRKGMGKSMEEAKLAVETGYWPLFRFNPALKAEGKNPLTIDSKAPAGDFQGFLSGEVRYAALEKMAPEMSKKYRTTMEASYKERYQELQYLAAMPVFGEQVAPAAAAGSDDPAFCASASTAEHARPGNGEPCDEGRSGK